MDIVCMYRSESYMIQNMTNTTPSPSSQITRLSAYITDFRIYRIGFAIIIQQGCFLL